MDPSSVPRALRVATGYCGGGGGGVGMKPGHAAKFVRWLPEVAQRVRSISRWAGA